MSTISAVTDRITEPQQAARFLYDLIEKNKEPLGIEFVGLNERLRPNYPAVIVIAGLREKQHYGTHKFLVGIEITLMVYHGNLNDSYSLRSESDLNLVTAIENLIETDMEFGGRVQFAYVGQTLPIRTPRPTGTPIIGTQMTVLIESRKGFPYVP